MIDLNEIVCITTFKQGTVENIIERTRSEVFLDTIHNIIQSGINLVVLYTETSELFLYKLQNLGVSLVNQKTLGMGNIRREAIFESTQIFPNAKYFCWLEPEKPDLPKFILPLVQKMIEDKSEFGIFKRTSMESYPDEQAHCYLFCRSIATKLIGFDIDYGFGPMIMTPYTIPYFLEYKGYKYGDKWDSILVPRLRIISKGIKLSVLSIDFVNDTRMTSVESGNVNMMLKRLTQINNTVPALISEWQILTNQN